MNRDNLIRRLGEEGDKDEFNWSILQEARYGDYRSRQIACLEDERRECGKGVKYLRDCVLILVGGIGTGVGIICLINHYLK